MLYVANPKRYTILAKPARAARAEREKNYRKSQIWRFPPVAACTARCTRRRFKGQLHPRVQSVQALGASGGNGRCRVDFVTAKRRDCIRTIAETRKGMLEGMSGKGGGCEKVIKCVADYM